VGGGGGGGGVKIRSWRHTEVAGIVEVFAPNSISLANDVRVVVWETGCQSNPVTQPIASKEISKYKLIHDASTSDDAESYQNVTEKDSLLWYTVCIFNRLSERSRVVAGLARRAQNGALSNQR
jgi:hypothetical protein